MIGGSLADDPPARRGIRRRGPHHTSHPATAPAVLWVILALALGMGIGLSACTGPAAVQPPFGEPPRGDIPRTVISETDPGVNAPTWDVHDEIHAAYAHRYHAYWACLRAPSSCDTSYVLPGSAAAGHLDVTLAELMARDRFVGPEPVGYHRVEQIDLLPDGSAAVTTCWWSTAVLYGAPIRPNESPGPANPHTIVSSTPEGGRQRDLFVRTAAGWALARVEALDVGSSVDTCGGQP